jgi:hypothetical protein
MTLRTMSSDAGLGIGSGRNRIRLADLCLEDALSKGELGGGVFGSAS